MIMKLWLKNIRINMNNIKLKKWKANNFENNRALEYVGMTLDELMSKVCDILNIHESQIYIGFYDDYIGWRYKNLYKFHVSVAECKAGYMDGVDAYFYKDKFMQDKEWKKNEEKFKQVNRFLQDLLKKKGENNG